MRVFCFFASPFWGKVKYVDLRKIIKSFSHGLHLWFLYALLFGHASSVRGAGKLLCLSPRVGRDILQPLPDSLVWTWSVMENKPCHPFLPNVGFLGSMNCGWGLVRGQTIFFIEMWLYQGPPAPPQPWHVGVPDFDYFQTTALLIYLLILLWLYLILYIFYINLNFLLPLRHYLICNAHINEWITLFSILCGLVM